MSPLATTGFASDSISSRSDGVKVYDDYRVASFFSDSRSGAPSLRSNAFRDELFSFQRAER